jgi:hypothetical protein
MTAGFFLFSYLLGRKKLALEKEERKTDYDPSNTRQEENYSVPTLLI